MPKLTMNHAMHVSLANNKLQINNNILNSNKIHIGKHDPAPYISIMFAIFTIVHRIDVAKSHIGLHRKVVM